MIPTQAKNGIFILKGAAVWLAGKQLTFSLRLLCISHLNTIFDTYLQVREDNILL